MRTGICCLLASLTVLAISPSPASATWTLWLNDCALDNGDNGCTVSPGSNNAREYRSTIVQTPGASQITPFSRGDAVWNQVVQCVQEVYAPYDIVVVDEKPAPTADFHMALVAGQDSEIGVSGAGGIGLVACDPLDNTISFTFDIWGSDPELICGVIAQETAHNFGLDHEVNCASPMTYLQYCGQTFFRDENFTCGEVGVPGGEERPCRCTGPTQNSHRYLLGSLGENPNPPPGPTVSIQGLTEGQMVQDGFRVTVLTDHNRSINRVEFWVNGTQMHIDEGLPIGMGDKPQYVWVTPDSLADGIIDLEIKAFDDIQIETTQLITIQKGEPCVTADMCNDGQFCEDGRCKFPIATGELGDDCATDTDCTTGLCVIDGSDGRCSQNCDPFSSLDECGEGFECRTSGSQGFCWPVDGGCGCSASDDPRGALGTLFFMLGAFFFIRRRRR